MSKAVTILKHLLWVINQEQIYLNQTEICTKYSPITNERETKRTNDSVKNIDISVFLIGNKKGYMFVLLLSVLRAERSRDT